MPQPETIPTGSARGWERPWSLTELLRFAVGKEVARELSHSEFDFEEREWPYAQITLTSGVVFTDGSAMAIAIDPGWGGSDVTAGDEAEVVWYTYTPEATPDA